MDYKVVLFLTLVAGVSSDDDTTTTEEPTTTTEEPKEESSCTAIFSCVDCNTTLLCRPNENGSLVEMGKMKCPKALPYCNFATGTCTSVPDKTCGKNPDDFICLEDGYFPDIDCQIYHICDNYKATKFECKNQNYNAIKGICEKNATCGTMKCVNEGRKVANSAYPKYYAYCTENKSSPIIGRCPGKYELNETSQMCEAVCREEGVQQDVDNCTKYYKCQYTWIEQTKIMIKSHLDCPEGTGFDPSNYICVTLPSPTLPDCNLPK